MDTAEYPAHLCHVQCIGTGALAVWDQSGNRSFDERYRDTDLPDHQQREGSGLSGLQLRLPVTDLFDIGQPEHGLSIRPGRLRRHRADLYRSSDPHQIRGDRLDRCPAAAGSHGAHRGTDRSGTGGIRCLQRRPDPFRYLHLHQPEIRHRIPGDIGCGGLRTGDLQRIRSSHRDPDRDYRGVCPVPGDGAGGLHRSGRDLPLCDAELYVPEIQRFGHYDHYTGIPGGHFRTHRTPGSHQ